MKSPMIKPCRLALITSLVLCLQSGYGSATDRLVNEKRLVGQSDSHEECVGKLIKGAMFVIAGTSGRVAAHPDEDPRVVVMAKPRAISMTVEYFQSVTKEWSRMVASCEEEVYVQRTFIVDGPQPFMPPIPNMRATRTHVMDSMPSHDLCVADLMSLASLGLGATDIQEEDEGSPGEEMRLMLSGGVVSTEGRRQDEEGTWTTTTTTCVGGRETVVDRTSAASTAARPERKLK
jgi:hypothetical protein